MSISFFYYCFYEIAKINNYEYIYLDIGFSLRKIKMIIIENLLDSWDNCNRFSLDSTLAPLITNLRHSLSDSSQKHSHLTHSVFTLSNSSQLSLTNPQKNPPPPLNIHHRLLRPSPFQTNTTSQSTNLTPFCSPRFHHHLQIATAAHHQSITAHNSTPPPIPLTASAPSIIFHRRFNPSQTLNHHPNRTQPPRPTINPLPKPLSRFQTLHHQTFSNPFIRRRNRGFNRHELKLAATHKITFTVPRCFHPLLLTSHPKYRHRVGNSDSTEAEVPDLLMWL